MFNSPRDFYQGSQMQSEAIKMVPPGGHQEEQGTRLDFGQTRLIFQGASNCVPPARIRSTVCLLANL